MDDNATQRTKKRLDNGLFKKDLHEEMSFKMSVFISFGNKALNKKDKILLLKSLHYSVMKDIIHL